MTLLNLSLQSPAIQHPDKPASQPSLAIRTHTGAELAARVPWLESYMTSGDQTPLSRHPGWLMVLQRGLGHTPYCLEAVEEGKTRGVLPLCHVRSLLFGRFLVSLPYLNYGGVLADDKTTADHLLDAAVALADQLKVRYLELRSETVADHPKLVRARTDKVHMRMRLPETSAILWNSFLSKVRGHIRKAEKSGLTVAWGTLDVLPEFYAVFSANMRDLGTPTYGKKLFGAVLEQFPGRAELCVVRDGKKPVAAGLLLHGWGVTEVPSSSSLRSYNPLSPNTLLYWHLLQRAIERGQKIFDFGRSTVDSSTFNFKKQLGAAPAPTAWQCYARSGTSADMRADNPSYGRLVRLWQRLPLWLTRLIGPSIVRGIP